MILDGVVSEVDEERGTATIQLADGGLVVWQDWTHSLEVGDAIVLRVEDGPPVENDGLPLGDRWATEAEVHERFGSMIRRALKGPAEA